MKENDCQKTIVISKNFNTYIKLNVHGRQYIKHIHKLTLKVSN